MEVKDLLFRVKLHREGFERLLEYKLEEIYEQIKNCWCEDKGKDELFSSLRYISEALSGFKNIESICIVILEKEKENSSNSISDIWRIKLNNKLEEFFGSDEGGDTESRIIDELEYIIEALFDIKNISENKARDE